MFIVTAPVKVIPLLVFKSNVPVVFKVPPLNVTLVAVRDAGTAPKFLSELIFKIPLDIVVTPE